MWRCDSGPQFAFCIALGVIRATFKVRVPRMKSTISPGIVPVLFAIGKMSWQESVVIAAAGGIMQCVWLAKRKPTSLQILFNCANLALSSAVAYAISHQLAASAQLLLFLVAAIVYYLVDTLAVSTILPLIEEKPLSELWRNCHLWSFPFILAGGAFAAVWAQSNVPASFASAVTCAVMLYLVSAYYQEIVKRAGSLS
jgi:hypothetical protein